MFETGKKGLQDVVNTIYNKYMKLLKLRHKLYTTMDNAKCLGASFDGVEVKRVAEDILKLDGQDVAEMVRTGKFPQTGSLLFRALYLTAKQMPGDWKAKDGKSSGRADYLENLPAYASFMLKWAKATLISLKMKPTDDELAAFGDLCRG